ncbi:hypothetical protein, partial [Kosmotoga sp. DU53]|uniref:hypothetical protein n=1 Tax=Kosmotoga sp. DU53 TaxID=1310160 RepID=UPI001F1BAC97
MLQKKSTRKGNVASKNKSTQKRGIIFSNTREGRREDEEVRYEKCGGRLFKKGTGKLAKKEKSEI